MQAIFATVIVFLRRWPSNWIHMLLLIVIAVIEHVLDPRTSYFLMCGISFIELYRKRNSIFTIIIRIITTAECHLNAFKNNKSMWKDKFAMLSNQISCQLIAPFHTRQTLPSDDYSQPFTEDEFAKPLKRERDNNKISETFCKIGRTVDFPLLPICDNRIWSD